MFFIKPPLLTRCQPRGRELPPRGGREHAPRSRSPRVLRGCGRRAPALSWSFLVVRVSRLYSRARRRVVASPYTVAPTAAEADAAGRLGARGRRPGAFDVAWYALATTAASLPRRTVEGWSATRATTACLGYRRSSSRRSMEADSTSRSTTGLFLFKFPHTRASTHTSATSRPQPPRRRLPPTSGARDRARVGGRAGRQRVHVTARRVARAAAVLVRRLAARDRRRLLRFRLLCDRGDAVARARPAQATGTAAVQAWDRAGGRRRARGVPRLGRRGHGGRY